MIKLFSASLLIILILFSCDKKEETTTSFCTATLPTVSTATIDLTKLSAACFTASQTGANIYSGDYFAKSHWNDPHVLNINSEYVMYLSSPTDFDANANDVGIYRLTGTDALNWTQSPVNVLIDRNSASWSSKAVETPAMAYFKGQYHMFFTGYATAGSTNFRIGHATSCNGIDWSVDQNYLIGPSSLTGGAVTDFNYYIVAEPAPVVFNNKLYLYFTATGFHADIDDIDAPAGSIVESIGFITSSDGLNWSNPQMAFKPNQAIWPRTAAGANKWRGFSTPNAIVLNEKMYIFHDVIDESGGWKQTAISFASSIDGETSWTQSTLPIFTILDFGWGDQEVRSPSVVLNGTTLHLWFAGHSLLPAPFTLGVSHATCNLAP